MDHLKWFADEIASLTLGSGTTMILKRGKKAVPIYLEPRSLIKLTGDARYKWTHQIDGKKTDKVNGKIVPRETRISITFRKVKN